MNKTNIKKRLFKLLYTVLPLQLLFRKDLQIMNFALMQTKHHQNEQTQRVQFCVSGDVVGGQTKED